MNLSYEEQRVLYSSLGEIIQDRQFGESWKDNYNHTFVHPLKVICIIIIGPFFLMFA